MKNGQKIRMTLEGTYFDTFSIKSTGIKTKAGSASFFNDDIVAIEEVKEPFDPKPGEFYLVRNKYNSTRGKWMVIQDGESEIIKMVSPAGVFSVLLFKSAYVGDNWEIVKAKIVEDESERKS